MTEVDREAAVLAFVRAGLSNRLDMPPEQIELSSELVELGLQSIDAVLLCGEVEDHFQVELDPSTIFEHDTVGAFVAAVVGCMDAR